MKSVLISIKPKYCELIASGKKTIEVRKSRPKIETPFKCYIYCTIGNGVKGDYLVPSNIQCGKVIGEFVCNKVEVFSVGSLRCDDIEKLACLSYTEMINYFYKPEELDGKTAKFGYGWHISDLKIYDKPKELREFKRWNRTEENAPCAYTKWLYPDCKDCKACNLTRPPQSWCYVESLGE